MRNILFICLLALGMIGCRAKILAADDFSESDVLHWWVEEDGFGRTFIANGKLFVEVNQANAIQYATYRNAEFEDFSVQVDTTLVSGSHQSSHGILIRKQTDGAFYRFAIADNGTFRVDRHDSAGNWTSLTSTGHWEKSDAINTQEGETNRLRVTTLGRTVIFEVNETLLYRNDAFDAAYLGGNIALSAGTFSEPGTQVSFDNFVVREVQ